MAGWFNSLRKRWKDELAALPCLTDALVQERFKRIVVDGAPMVTSMRVVELTESARGWFSALHGVLSKYKSKGLGELADDMAACPKHIKRFEDALASPTESRFVVVTCGEEVPAAGGMGALEGLQRPESRVAAQCTDWIMNC